MLHKEKSKKMDKKYIIEFRVRLEHQESHQSSADWDNTLPIHSTIVFGRDGSEAINAALPTVEQLLDLTYVVEVRWNIRGSLQGHYKTRYNLGSE